MDDAYSAALPLPLRDTPSLPSASPPGGRIYERAPRTGRFAGPLSRPADAGTSARARLVSVLVRVVLVLVALVGVVEVLPGVVLVLVALVDVVHVPGLVAVVLVLVALVDVVQVLARVVLVLVALVNVMDMLLFGRHSRPSLYSNPGRQHPPMPHVYGRLFRLGRQVVGCAFVSLRANAHFPFAAVAAANSTVAVSAMAGPDGKSA